MPLRYSLPVIQDEVRHLLERGVIHREQPIYTLCRYIPRQEWPVFELELEANDFLLRDRIADLVPTEEWNND